MLAGDAVAAEAGIRIAEGSPAQLMDEPMEGAVGSRLAHALLAQGRVDEAAGASGVEQDLTGSAGTRVLWLSASAKVEAVRSNAELALARATKL